MKTIHNMFEHLSWANQSILEALQNVEVGEQQLSLFSHILNAEQVWLTRLKGKDSSQLPIWSDGDITVCTKLIKQNEENFKTYLAEIAKTDLDNLITYANSSGKEFMTSIRDILTHVALHGQYHRGQINLRLRADGNDPVNIDYITFVR
ncbi:DinB family protein [Paenibacillus crassostreae]|uniref:Damage-inducible protein DinB n=1 Tax=Paenibacillus crassostreae TaxID=1763538 RepID=A0A167FCS2_9BACL|nr:DinB family protein [Paenibacillus crassostreae]AOZ90816.1 damage-inducible protein DinB [Paenibacillus crassostreae]OAB76418.1 damage-inducible protein DinB [Paenibacillus crassostreae]